VSDTSIDLDAPTQVAVHLLNTDRLSLGRAAELAGTDVRGMLDTLGYDLVPVVVEGDSEEASA
jgi:predicted HTH domain antitoxin